MHMIKPFSQLDMSDVEAAGGKGASLGEMLQAGIAVPDGFVVLSGAFEEFITRNEIEERIAGILSDVDTEQSASADSASEKIQKLILEHEPSKELTEEIESSFDKLDTEFVAVRSSATAEDSADAAWAGQLDSYLYVKKSNLVEHVQKCWASLFTPRAIFYRFEKGLDKIDVSVAVVVQKMVRSEVSGVAFSVHPVTEDHDQLIIEAGIGLGEAIVSGSITPDNYVVSKSSRQIISKHVGNQSRAIVCAENGGSVWKDINDGESQKLTDEQILDLAEQVVRIEEHYGFPVDVEWALEDKEIYIVQSRPITTLTK